jgi:hypothetical protein
LHLRRQVIPPPPGWAADPRRRRPDRMVANLRGQTTTEFANLRGEMTRLELRLVLWLGGIVVAAAGGAPGALFAALHHWPPH